MNSIENNLCHLIDGNTNKDLYIFCVGLQGEAVNQILLKKNIHIKGFLDNNRALEGSLFMSLKVSHPSVLSHRSEENLSDIFVIICPRSRNVVDRISNQLEEVGLKKEQIAPIISED